MLHAEQSKNMGDAGTSVANATIDLPTDFIRAISLRLGEDDAQFVDDDVFWSHSDNSTTPTRTLARVFNEKIEMYPAPASGQSTKLRYVKKPTALSAGTDTPALPEELHTKIVAYARAHALYKEGNEGMGDRYMAMYEDNLAPMPIRGKLQPGTITLAPDAAYFDTSEYLD